MVSKEEYIIREMKIVIEEYLKENQKLTGVFMLDLKKSVELWASEHDRKYRASVSLGDSKCQSKEVVLV